MRQFIKRMVRMIILIRSYATHPIEKSQIKKARSLGRLRQACENNEMKMNTFLISLLCSS